MKGECVKSDWTPARCITRAAALWLHNDLAMQHFSKYGLQGTHMAPPVSPGACWNISIRAYYVPTDSISGDRPGDMHLTPQASREVSLGNHYSKMGIYYPWLQVRKVRTTESRCLVLFMPCQTVVQSQLFVIPRPGMDSFIQWAFVQPLLRARPSSRSHWHAKMKSSHVFVLRDTCSKRNPLESWGWSREEVVPGLENYCVWNYLWKKW